MTLCELDHLSVRHRQQQEREDRRAALIAWVLVNVNRDTESRSEPFDLEEVTAWLGYSGQYVRPPEPEPQEPEQARMEKVLGQVELLNQLYGGIDQRNGSSKD
jgi:hypothetical protein